MIQSLARYAPSKISLYEERNITSADCRNICYEKYKLKILIR